jgi:hypothetical protein
VRTTCKQGFVDSLDGGGSQDGGPNVAIRDQNAYEWHSDDHYSYSEDNQIIDCGV